MQNLNDGNNISDKELLPLIEYAKWELYNFNLLKNSKKLTELELILIDKDILRKWKEKSGYNKFKKQIFSYLFNLNKIKKQKEKINIENENLSEKWKKLISEGVVNPNNIKSISKTDLSGFYLSLKENKINAYKDYEVISSKEELTNAGFNLRVVSMPSMYLFDKQSQEYKESILPKDKYIFAMEMSDATHMYKYVRNGRVFSINTFGASGKANDVINAFGYTKENICKLILDDLKKD